MKDIKDDNKPARLSFGVRCWFWFFLCLQVTGFVVLLRLVLYKLGVHLTPWVI